MSVGILKRARGLFGAIEIEAPPKPAVPRRTASPFHAVTVVPGRNACPGARALEGRRFLSKSAPVLPLQRCAAAECTCRYQHHEDRRGPSRRARDLGAAMDAYEEQDRRSGARRGRRKNDR